MTFSLHGVGVSQGIAIGRVHLVERNQLEVSEYRVEESEVETEVDRLLTAIARAKHHLREVREHIPASTPTDIATFIDTHLLMLEDGYYGAAKHFEFVSKHTHFPRGQGLPGAVWAANTPILMRDLGSSYGFVRSESAGQAGLTTGLGLPVPVPSGETFVLTLLSARGTRISRRFEIWDARAARVGKDGAAVLIDGICAREGRLWAGEAEEPRRAAAWQGLIGRVLGSGLPVVDQGVAGIAAGYENFVALPIHSKGEVSHIVAWYS